MHVINILWGGVLSADEVTPHDVYGDDMRPCRAETFASTLSASWINDAVVLGRVRTCKKIARKRAAAADVERSGSHHTSPSV